MAAQRRQQQQRGSVVLIAVAVLTIVAMVGMTFVLVASADRRESDRLIETAPAKKIALGVLTKVLAVLVDDLHFNAQGQSTHPFEVDTGWLTQVDGPYPAVDPWLSWTAPVGGPASPVWPQISRVLGGGGNYADIPATLDSTPDTPLKMGMNDWYVDTDGDGRIDALLVDTGVRDPVGNYYYAAVRVIDLCSLINVNIASRTGYNPTNPGVALPVAPYGAAYDSGQTLGIVPTDMNAGAASLQLNVEALYEKRSRPHPSFNLVPISHYWYYYARCPSNPMPTYMPSGQRYFPVFSLDDQLALMWLVDNSSKASYTARGRLVDALGEAKFRSVRRFLTAYNNCRMLVLQVPRKAAGWPIDPDRFDQVRRANLNTADLQALYQAFHNAIPPNIKGLTDGAGNEPRDKRRRLAAQLAVCAIDFRDKDGDYTVWDVPGAGNEKVFGVERQLFVSEVFFKIFRKEENVRVKYSAIELFNPYDSDVSFKGAKLVQGGGEKIPSGGWPALTVPARGRVVIVSSRAAIPVHADTPTGRVVQIPGLDLSQGVKIYRARKADGAGEKDVLIAEVEKIDNLPDPEIGLGSQVARQWDDRVDKARYALANDWQSPPNSDYTNNTGGGTMTADKTWLGRASDPNLYGNFKGNPTPVYVRNGGFVSIGDLFRIFHVGPGTGGSSLAGNLGDGGSIAVGRLDASQDIGNPPYPGQVPAVHPACHLSEYFTVIDPTCDGVDNDADGLVDEPTDPTETAVAGLLNINTAPRECLLCLPYMTDAIVNQLFANRDKKQVWFRPFATSGEFLLAVRQVAAAKSNEYPPNYEVADDRKTDDGLEKSPNDLTKLQVVYTRLANLITTRSDSFGVYITMMRFKGSEAAAGNLASPDAVRRYVAVVDRSECNKRGDWPRIVMFTEVQ